MGTLWVNAILMTVLPLVVSGLVVAIVTAARTGLVGRLGGRAAALFLLLLVFATASAALVVPPLAAALPVSEEVAARFRESLAAAPPTPAPKLTAADWIANLLPANVFRAAADGAMLSLVLFAILFAAAVSRVSERARETLLSFFRGVSEAMAVLLSGIVRLAPVAIFALSLALAARVGLSATGALGIYVLALSGLCLALTLGLMLVPWLLARVSPVLFARAAAPAQLVAFAAHSSLASLPAMLDGAERVLEHSEAGVPFRSAARRVDAQGVGARALPRRGLLRGPPDGHRDTAGRAPRVEPPLAGRELQRSRRAPRSDPRHRPGPCGRRPADFGGRPAARGRRRAQRVPQRRQLDGQPGRGRDPRARGAAGGGGGGFGSRPRGS